MLEFKPVELSDKQWADELLALSDFRGCEYSFGNNFIWREQYNIQIARVGEFYLLKNNNGFLYPAGRGDIAQLVAQLREYCKATGHPFVLTSMNKSCMEKLYALYGEEITIETNRDLYDYIYTYESLSTLKGKKLHSKRNHINRFFESNWSYESITPENIEECKEMSKEWCEINNCAFDEEKEQECCAVSSGLEHFFALSFSGGLLRVDGKVHAFTFGEKLNSDTFVVHVEKALTEVQGTYPAINYEFVNHACAGYSYINREEDMGAENLRKAKLSYKPVFLEEKFKVSFSTI